MEREFRCSRKKILTIHNYCNTVEYDAKLRRGRPASAPDSQTVCCVNVGLLHFQKNQAFLIRLIGFMRSRPGPK
jgi:hypothetical protein